MKKSAEAPPWLARLLTPLAAGMIARQMAKEHPGLSAAEIGARMRAGVSDARALGMIDAVVARLPELPQARENASGSLPSAVLLVLANLVPLYGVLFWDWDVFPLLLLFWMENVAIGVLNVARLLFADPGDAAQWLRKIFLVPFFCIHYGMFTVAHGAFVLSGMFGSRDYDTGGLEVIGPALQAAGDHDLWLPVAALAASHLFSFFWNYLYRGEYRRTTPAALMAKPYVRVVALHFTIILGGIGAMALGSPLSALVLLVAIKTGFDVAAHMREHRAPAA